VRRVLRSRPAPADASKVEFVFESSRADGVGSALEVTSARFIDRSAPRFEKGVSMSHHCGDAVKGSSSEGWTL
jgi:hypothetical protein